MATNRRVSRVASLIKREVGQMLLFDSIRDERVGSGMVSVTEVEVSGDLQHAKIFVSIYGNESARAETMAGLRASTGFVRTELGQRIRLRRTPEVLFVEDQSLERGTRILGLLNKLGEERQDRGWDDLDAIANPVDSLAPSDLDDEFEDNYENTDDDTDASEDEHGQNTLDTGLDTALDAPLDTTFNKDE